MRLQPGDPDKQSLKDRGLTWEMILQAIESEGLLDVLTDTAHPGQVVLAVDLLWISPGMCMRCLANSEARICV